MSRDILLTGSVGLDSAEEVFRTLGRVLGTRAPRLPDGETGYARSVWIQSQAPFFLGNPAFEQVEPDPDRPGELRPARMPSKRLYSHTAAARWQGRASLRPGVRPEDVRFDNIGYADAAAVRRPIGWVHMPVPRDRNDDAYFAPLHDLQMHPETQIYWGSCITRTASRVHGSAWRPRAAMSALTASRRNAAGDGGRKRRYQPCSASTLRRRTYPEASWRMRDSEDGRCCAGTPIGTGAPIIITGIAGKRVRQTQSPTITR